MVMADDDHIRTGTVWTAAAHAITAVIGSGVLSLPWSIAQLGWIFGPIALVACAGATYFTSTLLSDCYRTGDSVHGKRNRTYMDVVKSFLGPRDVLICGIAQYGLLYGVLIAYTITVAMSMATVERSNCLYFKGRGAKCESSQNLYIIIFGLIEIVLSQFPNLEKLSWVSFVAAAMSFAYSIIALALSAVKLASNHEIKGTLFGVQVGVDGVSESTKIWNSFQGLGGVAFAFGYAMIHVEVQDTLKSPPDESTTMKRAARYAIGITTMFYISLGCVGYAAFGNTIPGNILTGFEGPFWLVDIANIAVIVHLIGAFQIFTQTIFAKYEAWLGKKWPESTFFHDVYTIPLPLSKSFKFTLCKLVLRTALIVVTVFIAMLLPFFTAIAGLLGALAFWPLTVYYPVTTYIVQKKIKRCECRWWSLQSLNIISLLVSVIAAVGSVAGIATTLKHVEIF